MIKKIAAVILPVTCVLTMGASLIAWFAVPSAYPAMEELTDYSFEAQPGAQTTWTVTRRIGDRGSVASGVSGFDAVVKAANDLASRLSTKKNEMTQLQQLADSQLTALSANQVQDRDAVLARAQELEGIAKQYEQELLKRSATFQDLSVQARAIRDEVGLRRNDVTRLQAELEELRTDLFQLSELRRILTDRLVRIRLDNQNLLAREKQLEQQ